MLAELGVELDAVLEITADPEEVTKRLLNRARLEGRVDDTEDVIRKRLEVYAESHRARHGVLRRARASSFALTASARSTT